MFKNLILKLKIKNTIKLASKIFTLVRSFKRLLNDS